MAAAQKSPTKSVQTKKPIANIEDFQAYLKRQALRVQRQTKLKHEAVLLADKLVHDKAAKLHQTQLREAIALVFTVEDILAGDTDDKPAEIRKLLKERELPVW